MTHATSESDVTSIGPSSASPRDYYVQSPSGDSQDDMDKCSSSNGRSPLDSPSDPRHSLTSSSSTAVSRIFGNRRRWNKHYCNMVAEEGGGYYDDDDYYGSDGGYLRQCNLMVPLMAFGLVFGVISLGFWGAGSHYKPQVSSKSLRIHSLLIGEGSDHTGVPTKFITLNCSANLVIYNPATFFGVHVSSHSANLFFSQITVATGQLKKYYQPKKSKRTMWVRLVGKEIPLYGAGVELAAADKGGGIPLKLEFIIRSRGYLMGRLLKARHTIQFSCFLVIASDQTKQIVFDENSCTYF